MKRTIICAAMAATSAVAVCAACGDAQTIGGITLDSPIATWDDGIPLGNGGAGALLWGGGDTLNITLDRADFWHNIEPSRYGSPDFTWETLVDVVAKKDDARRRDVFDKGESATKLPGVRFVMKLGEGQTLRRFRLDYKTGIATVTVATPQGEREVCAWFDNGDKLLSLQVSNGVSFVSKEFVKNPSFEKLGGYPEAEIKIDNAKAVYRRSRRKGADNRFDTDFEAGVRFCGAGEYSKRTTSKEAEFWAKFNAKSSVSIPDADMQRQYDFAMYLYGAGARTGHPPLALQGLWTADNGKLPPWHGDYHNDMNTEMTYWAAGPAGHIEALEAFADFFIERLPECRAFCRKIFKGGEGAVIPPTMGYAAQPILGWTAYTLPPTHGIWAFNTFCDAWDYDPTPEKAAKYLAFGRELAAGLEHSWKMVDDVRKLDISCSPEVGNNSNGSFLTPNSTYERVILDSFYTWLARLAEACGEGAEAAKWRGYVGSFGPPNVTADGVLELAAGRLLGASHRHPSHLIQVFPLVDVPIDAGVDFLRSVDQWEALTTKAWVGFSFPWAGCFEARLGRGDRAFRYLKDFQRAFTSRCGFNLNGDQLKCGLSNHTYRPFTLEANFGYARGIQEMLLSYDPHNKEVHLFRALPKEWDGKEVSFRNLRVPGGCRISARRSVDGKVSFTAEGHLPGPVMYNYRRVEACGMPANTEAEKRVSLETMKSIYEEVKTPHKVGMVLLPEKGEMLDGPSVFRYEDAWYMIFITFDGKGYETHLAKSADLVKWERLGQVFARATGECWDSAQADGWPLLLDPRWGGPNTLNKFDGRYWMMYIGGAMKGYETDPLSTGVAWTDDPSAVKQWTRYPKNPVLSPSDLDARDFERKTIFKHYVVEDPSRSCGGRFVDFYNAKQKGVWRETIGMAVSDDMLNWRRVGDGPVISDGNPAKFAISGDPMIQRIGDVWVMFYFGCGWKRGGAFDTFACSYDLKHWTKWGGKPLIEPSEPYDATYAHKPWVIKHNGVVYHFYCAVGNKGRGIALATSSDVLASTALCNAVRGHEFRLGVGAYEGRAAFKELRITDAAGKVVYSNGFATPDAMKGWIPAGRGTWKCGGGTLEQTFGGLGHEAATLSIPQKFRNATLTVKAKKIDGKEGFIVSTGKNLISGGGEWIIFGGWANKLHGIEQPPFPIRKVHGAIEQGRWYDVKVECMDDRIRAWLDGMLVLETFMLVDTSTRPASVAPMVQSKSEGSKVNFKLSTATRYSPMIFGHFIEHHDRQVYGGLFWPGHPLSDEDGFRKDVIEALRDIKVPIVRWPGGCFVSAYHWKYGIGPKRQSMWDKAWEVEDPNTFGTDEYVKWCRKVGCEPYICTNAGSGNEEEMSDWVEYCNLNVGKWGRQRIANGYAKPHDVMYWSVGNENWGGWEMGAKTVAQWGPLVRESAKMMRGTDRRIYLLAAATPNENWTLPLLKTAGYLLDYVSIHEYYGGGPNQRPYLDWMMRTCRPENTILRTIDVLNKAGFGGGKVGIAFDEWNMRGWYHPRRKSDGRMDHAARRKNDIASLYNMSDAVFTACFLNTCLRHCDFVKMACFSPIVNTRGAVFVHDKGIVKRTTYHVFWMYTHLLQPNVVPLSVDCGNLSDGKDVVPVLDAVLTVSDDGKRRALAVVNKSPDKEVSLDVSAIAVRSASAPYQATVLSGASTDDYNDIGAENRVVPVNTSLSVKEGKVALAPHSFSVIELGDR